MSTIAFTLMFAVWLMFGILGVPIQKEFGLTDSINTPGCPPSPSSTVPSGACRPAS